MRQLGESDFQGVECSRFECSKQQSLAGSLIHERNPICEISIEGFEKPPEDMGEFGAIVGHRG